jgi:hypothetical protein
VGDHLIHVEFAGVHRIEEAAGEVFDDAPAGHGDGDGADGGVLGLCNGMKIGVQAGYDVGRGGDARFGAQTVFERVAAACGFAGGSAGSSGAEGVPPAGGDLGCGAHMNLARRVISLPQVPR